MRLGDDEADYYRGTYKTKAPEPEPETEPETEPAMEEAP
jgi:hypothetical protein